MKLCSFGCSFVYGSDLLCPNNAWPALMAKDLDLPYECHARPGIGNLQIMESILRHSDTASISVINWTWIDRFDFVDTNTEKWQTLRPVLDHPHAEYYFKKLHSQYRDMLTNLIYINTALDFLRKAGCQFVMTAMDDLLFEPVQKEWHDPSAVSLLQSLVKPYINDFEGTNFLDWSRKKGFDVSDKWHPLEQAHRAAADLFIDAIRHRA